MYFRYVHACICVFVYVYMCGGLIQQGRYVIGVR